VVLAAMVAAASCWSLTCSACYSGLILIPTTDVAGAYVWVLDVQWQGYSKALYTEQVVLNTEFGLGDRFEIGIDVNATSDFADRRVRLNAKYVLFRSEQHKLELAVGTQNMSETFTPFPYVVASKDWGLLRTHAGVQRESESRRTNWFVGVDRTFDERWQVMADYTSGSENYASAGAGYVGKHWQLFLGAQWPNAGGPALAVIHVIFTGDFRRHGG